MVDVTGSIDGYDARWGCVMSCNEFLICFDLHTLTHIYMNVRFGKASLRIQDKD